MLKHRRSGRSRARKSHFNVSLDGWSSRAVCMLPSEEAKANGSQAGADWIAAEKAADGAAPIEKGARARLRVLATVARLPANRAPEQHSATHRCSPC